MDRIKREQAEAINELNNPQLEELEKQFFDASIHKTGLGIYEERNRKMI